MFEKMVENMKDSGKITKCLARVCLFGVMEEYIKANTQKIKSMDLESLFGKMVEDT